MSLLGPSWLTFGGAVVLAFGLGSVGGFVKGTRYEKHKQEVAIAQAAEVARKTERDTARTTFRLQEVRDAENTRTTDRLVAELERLRGRPARMPAATAAACVGGDGAGLSGPDAGFLAGEAARANKLRADLETARRWIEAVTK